METGLGRFVNLRITRTLSIVLDMKIKTFFCSLPIIALCGASFAQAKLQPTQKAKVAQAAPQPKLEIIRGKVFERGTDKKKMIFTYERRISREATTSHEEARYFFPDGKLAYEESYLFRNGAVEVYDYNQKQVNDIGHAEVHGDKISFRFSEDGETKTKEIEDKGLLVFPATIARTLASNWDTLMKGETLQSRFVLVERLDTVGFSFKLKKELVLNGVEAVQVQMRPTSFIIAAIVNPILMTLEKNGGHRLLESDGRLPLRKPKYDNIPKSRSDWKAIDAILDLEY